MASHLRRDDGRLRLERTGPFMPPVTFPGVGPIVITAKVREELQHSELTGAAFVPVVKHRIVKLDWRSWNLDAAAPLEYPEEGEPENYILERPHDPAVAIALGDLWEVQLGNHAETVRIEGHSALRADTWDATDLFHPGGTRIPAASEQAADWFRLRYPEWVYLDELKIAQG